MKVLICGTNYGSTYLRALAMDDSGLQAAGVLSTGSERSKSYAASLGIPHYTAVSEVPAGSVDMACVAVAGDDGIRLTKELLSSGIHVLAEHPVGVEQVQGALELARENQRVFQVNAHFADLQAPQAFIQSIQTARQLGPALHYSLSVNLRTLYSGLDLLGRAHGSLQGAKVRSMSGAARPALFEQLTIELDGVRATVVCQNFSSERDDGSANLINHRLGATFGHGDLLLAESNGPVLWFPAPLSMPQESWQNCLPVDLKTVNSMQLQQQRDFANLLTLREMVATIRHGNRPLQQQPGYLLALAGLWQDCLGVLHPDCTRISETAKLYYYVIAQHRRRIMSRSRNTSVVLGAHYDEFVADRIDEGHFQTVSEAVRAGLKLLEQRYEEHQTKLQALRDAIEKGENSPVVEDFSPVSFLEEMRRKHL